MIRTISVVLCFTLSVSTCCAEFFANIGESSQSKEASAGAFEAIANVFLGLAKLEREGSKSSDGGAFDDALSKLSTSIDQFKTLAESNDFATPIDLSSTSPERLGYYMDFYKIPLPAKAGDLFATASIVLAKVYESIKVFLDKRGLEEYNSMQREISNAVGFGELASEIARQNKL